MCAAFDRVVDHAMVSDPSNVVCRYACVDVATPKEHPAFKEPLGEEGANFVLCELEREGGSTCN